MTLINKNKPSPFFEDFEDGLKKFFLKISKLKFPRIIILAIIFKKIFSLTPVLCNSLHFALESILPKLLSISWKLTSQTQVLKSPSFPQQKIRELWFQTQNAVSF